MELADVSSVLRVIAQDEEIGVTNQIMLLGEVLRDPKTESMFNCALKMDKELFVQKMSKMVQYDNFFPIQYMSKQDKTKLKDLVRNTPYLNDYLKSTRDQYGNEHGAIQKKDMDYYSATKTELEMLKQQMKRQTGYGAWLVPSKDFH